MSTYSQIEDAVVARLIEYFPQLSDTRCKAADVDAVLNALFEEGAKDGCIIEYNGGSEDTSKPFAKQVWTWVLQGIYIIRFTDTIETDLRTFLNTLPGLFRPDYTLGGLTPLAKITSIGEAEAILVNDVPFYWISFRVEVIER